MSTPWEEEQERLRAQKEARESKQAAMRLVSGLGIHPELGTLRKIGEVTFTVPSSSEERGECVDPDTIDAYEAWADETEVCPEALPVVPNIGDKEWWPCLLQAVAGGSEEVKFPPELGERLRPWIPAEMWGSVVKQ